MPQVVVNFTLKLLVKPALKMQTMEKKMKVKMMMKMVKAEKLTHKLGFHQMMVMVLMRHRVKKEQQSQHQLRKLQLHPQLRQSRALTAPRM